MDQFNGYPVRTEHVEVVGRKYELLLPADPDLLLDDECVQRRFARDEYMPYWATIWPGALLLADHVATWGPAPQDRTPPTVLELGSGVGLVGLVAASLGYAVTLSDYDEDALRFAAENARRNGVNVSGTRLIDWRESYVDLRPERVVAADVLYEARNLEPVAAFVARHLAPDGLALVSDANRSTADAFERVAWDAGLAVTVQAVQRPTSTAGVPIRGRIYHLRRTAGGLS